MTRVPELEPQYVYARLSAMDLVYGYCPNKHINVFGFPQQLKTDGRITARHDAVKLQKICTLVCKDCGCEVETRHAILPASCVGYLGPAEGI